MALDYTSQIHNPSTDGVSATALQTEATSQMVITMTPQRKHVPSSLINVTTLNGNAKSKTYHLGRPRLGYKEEGKEVVFQKLDQNVSVIGADLPLRAGMMNSEWINKQQELGSAHETRFVSQIADIRAVLSDTQEIATAIKAASTPSPVAGNYGGEIMEVEAASMSAVTPAMFKRAVHDIANLMAKRNVNPADYYIMIPLALASQLLWEDEKLFDRQIGGEGSFNTGTLTTKYLGMNLLVVPTLSSKSLITDAEVIAEGFVDVEGNPNLLTKYRYDGTDILALVVGRNVVGRVDLQPFSVTADNRKELGKVTTLEVQESYGYGVIDPSGAILVKRVNP